MHILNVSLEWLTKNGPMSQSMRLPQALQATQVEKTLAQEWLTKQGYHGPGLSFNNY